MSGENKEQLNNLIEQVLGVIENLLQYQAQYATLEWDVLIRFKEYLHRIKQDLADDIVPDGFIDILENDIRKNDFTSTFAQFVVPTEEYLQSLIEKFKHNLVYSDSYDLYSKLNYAQENIVLIGANGCGKTSLANVLKETMHFNAGIVIPAQKLLVIPTVENIPSFSRTKSIYDSYQQVVINGKLTYQLNDSPYQILNQYGTELKNILSMLIAERNNIRNMYCDNIQQKKNPAESSLHCKMDDVVEIWNYLIEHRRLACESGTDLVLYDGSEKYPAYQMSDGEKVILYLVARVLLAPENALIVSDEPEMYLHPTIVNKLWDTLETKRPDCRYIYLTHNLNFAESRNAVKCWIKTYQPRPYPRWTIEKCDFDSGIPEKLLLKLLGSRKKILFCEGTKDSLDRKIFESLFRDYTIVPVENCTSVIRFAKAFNKMPNPSVKAYGLIDRDFLGDDALEKLKNDNIYSYDVAEIENLLLMEDFIKAFEIYKNETDVFAKIKQKVLEQLKRDAGLQASKYVVSRINFIFLGENGIKGKNDSEIKTSFDAFCSQINVSEMYNTRVAEINNACDAGDYTKAIRIYNNKGLKSIVESALGMKNYHERALDFIQRDTTACEILRKAFPNELFSPSMTATLVAGDA